MLYFWLKTLIVGDPTTGFPTLIIVMLFLGGIQLLSLGIIGEYVARIFVETKGRPVYIASEYNDKKI
jgi:glycosyltransferase involved in cell wall biosynthesis